MRMEQDHDNFSSPGTRSWAGYDEVMTMNDVLKLD
jgi:hypothetical protein